MFQQKNLLPSFAIVLVMLLSLSYLSAQTVTFNVSGTNPRCQADYPNGAPYNGIASVQNIPGATIVSVTFEVQYLTGNGWAVWGNPFNVFPPFPTILLSYSQNTLGATPLTISATNLLRMKATIRYKVGNGEPSVAEAYSNTVSYNYFTYPRFEHKVNQQSVSATIPTLIYTCSGAPTITFSVYQVTGTGVRWRLSAYESNISGTQGQPFGNYAVCGWQTGGAPQTINIPNPYGNGSCTADWSSLNGDYILLRLEIENDCGYLSKDALLHVFQQPSGAQVNFFFRGSPQADGYTAVGPNDQTPTGEQNPLTLGVSQTDGILSWGGTSTNPTWVGASQTVLDCSSASFYGGLDYWTVDIDVFHVIWVNAGTYTEITPDNTQVNLQQVAMSLGGAPTSSGYFSQNFNNSPTGVLGKKFRVTLTGHGPCDQSPSKVGYFQITPTEPWHLTDPGNTGEGVYTGIEATGSLLKLAPNPATSSIRVMLNASAEAEAELTLYDANGQVVSVEGTGSKSLYSGENIFDFQIETLPPGMYWLRAQMPNEALVSRLIKH